MKLSRNKIAKLLKIGNQSRKNIKKQHKGRSKTLGAPHGADNSNSKAYLLSEDEMIMVPDNNNNNNKRRARSAHLKPKPLNLRFKTLKNRIIREEKREWSGEGGKLTADQQTVYDLLMKQKDAGIVTNSDILQALTAGKDVPTDLVLEDAFKTRFAELLKVPEHIYESPTTAAATTYDLAVSTTTLGTEGKIPPEVDFFTKILKGELYYLIDVEDIPKVVTYISSQPELKEIIAFKGADAGEGEAASGSTPNPTLENKEPANTSQASLAAGTDGFKIDINNFVTNLQKYGLNDPKTAKIEDIAELKIKMKGACANLSIKDTNRLISGRFQTINILAKIYYFYKNMAANDYVKYKKTGLFGKTFTRPTIAGQPSSKSVSAADLKDFNESKKALKDLLDKFRAYTGSIIKKGEPKSSLDENIFYYYLITDINPSTKASNVAFDDIYSNVVNLEQRLLEITARDVTKQKELYESYTSQMEGELTLDQMKVKAQPGVWKKFIEKNASRVSEVIALVYKKILPKARAFSTKTSKDTATKTAATAAQEVAGKKAVEDKAKQALVQAAQTIVDSLTTVATYAEATATDSTGIEHKDDIGNEIKKIEEAAAKLSTTSGAGALPNSPAIAESAPAAELKEKEKLKGEGAAEDIKNDPRVKITLNSFNKSLGKLKALLGTTTTTHVNADASLPEKQTNLAGQGGGGKPEVIKALKSLQTALAETPAVQETITTEAGKVTAALATIKETDGIDIALKEQITAALTIPTKESIDPILVQLQAPPEEGEETGTGTGQEPLKNLLTELTPNQASVEAASATNPDIKTTTAEALQKANELLAAVTAAAKLGAATAAKPVAPVAPSQMSNAEIQALKDRVAKLESDAKNTGDKDKDKEDEAAIKAIMMGDDAFAHKIQFLVDIPKWQQFKVIGSTDGSAEDAALNMTTDIARASLSDLKKKELDDDKQMREAIAKALQVIAAAKPKLNDPNPQIQEEANKKTLESLKELKSQLDKVTKDLADVKKREIEVVDNTKPLSTDNPSASSSETVASTGAITGASASPSANATEASKQINADKYDTKTVSPTKESLKIMITGLQGLLTADFIKNNKENKTFKVDISKKLNEIYEAAVKLAPEATNVPTKTAIAETKILIDKLNTNVDSADVNNILTNIQTILSAAPVVPQGGKRLSHHLTKRNNKNRRHGKYTFRNLKRGGNGATVTPPGAPVTPAETTVTPAEKTTATAGEEKKATPAPTAETAAPATTGAETAAPATTGAETATTGAETATTGAETATTTGAAAATGATPEETKQKVKELIDMFEALGKEKGLGVGVTLEGESLETDLTLTNKELPAPAPAPGTGTAAETANLPAAARAPATATTAATPAATATTATTAATTPAVPVVAEPVETTTQASAGQPAQASAGQPQAEPAALEPSAQALAGQPQAEPAATAPRTGGYKRHTRKNKTKKNRKNSKSKKSKKSKKRK